MASNPQAYKAIKEEADRIGWPQTFRQDLIEHDRGLLHAKYAPTVFGWSIRISGTDLYVAGSRSCYEWARVQKSHGAFESRWYWWQDGALTEVGYEVCIARLLAALHLEERADQFDLDRWKETVR